MKPSHVFGAIKRECWRIVARAPYGAQHQCCVCGRRVRRFLPYRGGLAEVPPLIRHLGAIGSDVENFECPVCSCHDRERHLLLYLKASNILSAMHGTHILHFAPEHHLQCFVRQTGPIEYVLADLFPASPSVQKMDLQAIPYPADYFDFVLANHVLEHVQDDAQALREIFRVLRPGGKAVLQTPYASGLTNTFEDPSIQTPLACLHAYGQEDHRRLYGQDFVLRVIESGLHSAVVAHAVLLPDVNSAHMGVNSAEPFFLFEKPLII